MFINAIIRIRKSGEPWRMHTAWLDRATGVDRVCYWIYAPSVCPHSWGDWERLCLGPDLMHYEIVEHWAEDFQQADWEGSEKPFEISVQPRRHGLEISLQDKHGFSYMAISPAQAREMSAYLAAWAESHGA